METKSEGFKIEDYKYKTHREQIEKAWLKWLEKKDMNKILVDFFGIPKESVHLITQEERNKIKIYFHHVCKRIVNAYLTQSKQEAQDIVVRTSYDENTEEKALEPEKYFEVTLNLFFASIMFHDISHSLEMVAINQSEGTKSPSVDVVPPFFRVPKEVSINNLDLIQREAFAGLFQRQLSGNTAPLSLHFFTNKNLRKLTKNAERFIHDNRVPAIAKDFIEDECIKNFSTIEGHTISKEEYIKAYIGFIQGAATLGQNITDMLIPFRENYLKDKVYPADPRNDENETKLSKEEMAERVKEYEKLMVVHREDQEAAERDFIEKEAVPLFKNIKYAIDHPPQVVLDSLSYIYDHRDNPRVLVDLFFKLTAEYFVRLDRKYEVKQGK